MEGSFFYQAGRYHRRKSKIVAFRIKKVPVLREEIGESSFS